MPTDESIDYDIIKKIDQFIEDCKSEIRKRKAKLEGKARSDLLCDDSLQSFVRSGRFSFNSCVEKCVGKNAVEAYKACRKRITDPKKHAVEDDYKKLSFLYAEMQKRFRAEDLVQVPRIPERILPNVFSGGLLPASLLEEMANASRYFDKTLLGNKKKR